MWCDRRDEKTAPEQIASSYTTLDIRCMRSVENLDYPSPDKVHYVYLIPGDYCQTNLEQRRVSVLELAKSWRTRK